MAINEAIIAGKLTESFKKQGDFFVGSVEVKRASGTIDKIKVVTENNPLIASGKYISLFGCIGKIRSTQKYKGFDIAVFTDIAGITVSDLEVNENNVILDGTVDYIGNLRQTFNSKKPIRNLGIMSDCVKIPCVLWNGLAESAEILQEDERVSLSGRLISRMYIKTINDEKLEIETAEVNVFTLLRA